MRNVGPDAQAPSIARIQVLRLKQVCTLTGLCRSVIYQLEQEGRFPGRIKLTEHAVGWIEYEVQEWLASRVSSSRARAQR
jgi:prophage regulatory protein